MKSLYLKSFLMSTCMVLVSFLLLGIVFVILGRGVLINERRESIENAAVVGSQNAMQAFRQHTGVSGTEAEGNVLRSMHLRMQLSGLSTISGHHVFVCDSNGVISNCSDKPGTCKHMNKNLSSTLISTLYETGNISALTNLNGLLSSLCYVAAFPIYNSVDGNMSIVGYAFAASDSSSLIDTWSTFLSLFSLTALLIVLLAMIMSYISSKRLVNPINEMTSAARRFSHGDFSARVSEDEYREDELGELTGAFNAMADSLQKSDELQREFIANVSHELKTPMTTIAGFADGILDGTIPAKDQEQYLTTISSETKRLARLVRKMLELSQVTDASPTPKEVNKRPFDISETLRQTLINFESNITEHDLDVDANIPEDSITVLGDSDAITQVVYNLLDNAIKFADTSSTLSISLWKQGRKAYVSVKNSGITIPETELPLVFDRFHKTDRSRSRDRDGVGLGLYIVKSILNSHGEDIYVSSKDGTTEFVFSLSLFLEKHTVKSTQSNTLQK